MSEPIYVSQSYLPPLKELLPYLEEIWESTIFTTGGQIASTYNLKVIYDAARIRRRG